MSGLLRFICPNTSLPPVQLHPEGGHISMPRGCRAISGQFHIPATMATDHHYTLSETHHLARQNYNKSFWITSSPIPTDDQHDPIIKQIKIALKKSQTICRCLWINSNPM